MSILNYNLSELPEDLMDLFTNDTFLDIVVIIMCTIIYVGGSMAVVYSSITKLRLEHMVALWMGCLLLNHIVTVIPRKLYGLCYVDSGNELAIGLTTLLGPFGTLRLIAIFLFFFSRVGPSRLLRKRVYNWDYPGYWAQTFKIRARERRDGVLQHKKGSVIPLPPKEKIKKIWKFLNKRIDII